MARVFLGLGSNIDAERNLRLGVAELRKRFGALDVSTVYRSAPVGFVGPDFLNVVAGLDSAASPATIHDHIEAIHELAGRRRSQDRFASRPLDIDLLLYGDLVLEDAGLRLPRCDILDYNFVLRPLAELAPDLVHPVTGRTLQQHWSSFDRDSHPLTAVELIL
jgi:2-amino-4-hydroxy-6-hydroxymethyldihydropteridine diphosphokinase